MSSEARQDFPDQMKRVLAQRAGGQCSKPDCRAFTSGPQLNTTKAVNVGVAAHITAASRGGPRYDAALTEEERSSAENGLWLCQTCAKLIDNDVLRYSTAVLRDWKSSAEEIAGVRVGKARGEDASEAVGEKWVSLQYAERAGLVKQLTADGFALRWTSANEESEYVDIDNWEYVLVEDKGRRCALKIRDVEAIGGYLVLLKRPRSYTAR